MEKKMLNLSKPNKELGITTLLSLRRPIPSILLIKENKVSLDTHFLFTLIMVNIFNLVNIHFHFRLNYLKIVPDHFINLIVNMEQILDKYLTPYGLDFHAIKIKN